MKFKYLILISLILTVLTVSAVTASDDVLAVNNSTDDLNDIEEDYLEQNEESSLEISDDIDYEICNEVTLEEDDEDYVIYFRSYDRSQTGTLNVYVDYSLKYTKTIRSSDYTYDSEEGEYEYYLNIYPSDLDMKKYELYNVKLTFNDETLAQETVEITYPLTMYIEGFESGYEDQCTIGERIDFYIRLPDDATNQLTLTVNGKSYPISYKNGEGNFILSTSGWSVGEYTARISYPGDSKYPSKYEERSFNVIPKFTCPDVIAKGENEFLTITAPSGTTGNAIIYNYDIFDHDKKTYLSSVEIKNGYGRFSLSGLNAGEYNFYIDYTIGNFHFSDYHDIIVKNNSPLFKSSISSTEITQGNAVTVKVTGPKVNSFVGIYLDDKEIKSLSLVNGEISHAISGLSLGNHKINVFYDVNNQFHSNTFYVTVKSPQNSKTPTLPNVNNFKPSLMLKSVKIKKSAKKIILTATLKNNGKAIKNSKIIFKFNGKKYTTKTNIKGVAKVTIKKSVLKKLKVGKKIKYQAGYGKLIVKKTAKVKK